MESERKKPMNEISKKRGIEFAPLNIPLSRRLETAAALYYTLSVFFFPGLVFVFYFLMGSYFWPCAILYFSWLSYDWNTPNKGGRRFEFMRRLPVWRSFADYFPAELVKTCDLDPSKNYLFGYHPHGIISVGAFLNFGTEATGLRKNFPGIKIHLLTLLSNLQIPIFRDYLMSYGEKVMKESFGEQWKDATLHIIVELGICSVARESMNQILSKPGGGNGAVVVVGGAREALYSCPTDLQLHLKSRKGFVKVAIQNGAQLVPVFGFGENEIILQVDNPEGSWLRRFQQKNLALTGYAPVVFFGRGVFQYSFGLLPLRRPLTVVVGAPIPVEKNPNPTPEEVNALHEKYVDELTTLFYTHRDKYADPNLQLTIV